MNHFLFKAKPLLHHCCLSFSLSLTLYSCLCPSLSLLLSLISFLFLSLSLSLSPLSLPTFHDQRKKTFFAVRAVKISWSKMLSTVVPCYSLMHQLLMSSSTWSKMTSFKSSQTVIFCYFFSLTVILAWIIMSGKTSI